MNRIDNQSVLPSAAKYPSVEKQIEELNAAGWKAKTKTIWQSPDGPLFTGPHYAWKVMQRMPQSTPASAISRNGATLADFVAYCEANPEQRFWQALRNWKGCQFILISDVGPVRGISSDTFHNEGK